MKSDSLSLTTTPLRVIRRLEKNASIRRWPPPLQRITDNTDGSSIRHVLRLARPEDVVAGKAPISCDGMLQGSPIYYEPEEYCTQLEHILRLIDPCPWFQAALDNSPAAGYILHVFQDKGFYIFKE